MKDGAISLLKLDTLQVVFEVRHTRMPIHVLRFTPDGTMLAVAAADGFVYLYDVDEMHLSLRKVLRTLCSSARISIIFHFLI